METFFHVCPGPCASESYVHWAALYFAWCEEKVEDKVLVEVQNESLF
jgi:hypothetical protein